QTFEVVAVNESGVEGKRTMGTVVSKETVVTPTDVTTKSSYAAGSVTGVVARVGLYVDGTLVRYGSITDGQYKVYIQDVAALKTVGKEFELRFLDSDSTVIRTVVQTVQ
ncbi:immunoglobulin-like domain-containing protein, partial [Listeria rocourtiae]